MSLCHVIFLKAIYNLLIPACCPCLFALPTSYNNSKFKADKLHFSWKWWERWQHFCNSSDMYPVLPAAWKRKMGSKNNEENKKQALSALLLLSRYIEKEDGRITQKIRKKIKKKWIDEGHPHHFCWLSPTSPVPRNEWKMKRKNETSSYRFFYCYTTPLILVRATYYVCACVVIEFFKSRDVT